MNRPAEPDPETPREWPCWPLMLCLLAGGVVLLSARGYLDAGTPYGDDNSSHLAVIWSLTEDLREGRTDFYFPGNNLGVPLFLSYPPLVHLSVAAFAAVLGGTDVATTLFKVSIVLPWALMPVAWAVGGRWMGLGPREAAIFGLLSIGMVDQGAWGLSMTSALHTGLYSQTFGTLLLPLTLGAFRRGLETETGRERFRWATRTVVLLWLMCLLHAFSGLLAIIASWVLVPCPLPGVCLGRRILRAAAVHAVVFLLLGFWLWPLLAHGDLVGGIPWKRETHEGWPFVVTVKRLLGGDVLDASRFPWMTLLFLAGVPQAVRRFRAPLAQWASAGFGVFLLLFLGPTNLGDVYRTLPLHGELNVTRYVSGLQLFGALFVVLGASWLVRVVWSWMEARFGAGARPVAIGLVVVAFAGYLAERHAFGREAFRTFDPAKPSFAALVDHLEDDPGTRIAVDSKLGTTSHFYRDLLPALSGRPQIQSYGMTYHATLATYYTEYFDFSPYACALYNVESLVGRNGEAPEVVQSYPKTFDQHDHQVYRCPARERGYFAFATLPLSIEGTPKGIRRAVRETLRMYEAGALARLLPEGAPSDFRSSLHFIVPASGEIPEGLEEAVERLSAGPSSRGDLARVVQERTGKTRFEADVEVDGRPSWLVLKLNAFPYWTATIDDRPVPIATVAPNFQAVRVPTGHHTIRFEYRYPAWSKGLAVVSGLVALVLAGLALRPGIQAEGNRFGSRR